MSIGSQPTRSKKYSVNSNDNLSPFWDWLKQKKAKQTNEQKKKKHLVASLNLLHSFWGLMHINLFKQIHALD